MEIQGPAWVALPWNNRGEFLDATYHRLAFAVVGIACRRGPGRRIPGQKHRIVRLGKDRQ